MYEVIVGIVAALITVFVFFVGMCCGYVLHEAQNGRGGKTNG